MLQNWESTNRDEVKVAIAEYGGCYLQAEQGYLDLSDAFEKYGLLIMHLQGLTGVVKQHSSDYADQLCLFVNKKTNFNASPSILQQLKHIEDDNIKVNDTTKNVIANMEKYIVASNTRIQTMND